MDYIIFLYLALCFAVGSIGYKRKMGFIGGFFCSLLLTPLAGWIITTIVNNVAVLPKDNHKSSSNLSKVEQLEKLTSLLEKGSLTQEEFEKEKKRIID